MKKDSFLTVLLAAALILSCLTTAGFAADTETNAAGFPDTTSNFWAPSDMMFGSVCVLNGCRTIDGNVPLAGSERRLETAQGVFAFERNTGTVVYSYNADARLSPGGLTKIVTALISIERCDQDEIVTVSSRNISRLPAGSQNQNLKEGEQLTVRDLLHCLILMGANDAAIALAEHVAGNQEAFLSLMNQRVKQMGCSNTQFANIHGLDNDAQYTTARDMARIVQEATRNETFRKLFVETSYTVPETNRNGERKFESQDYLVDSKNVQKFYDSRVTGGMQAVSSRTSMASVVYTAAYQNMDLVCVVLGATRQMYENGWQVKVYGNFEEALDLLNFVCSNYKANRVLYYGQALKQLAVSGGECDVVVAPHIDLDSVLPLDVQMDNLIMEYTDKGLKAPIAKDDLVATVEVWYRNTCLMEAELYAMEEVRLAANSGLQVLGGANRKDSESGLARFVLIASAVILIPVVGYLVINSILRSRRRAQMRRRRRSGGRNRQ